MESRPYDRIVPLIIATALFMENMDSTVIATSLPAIARALVTSPLTLKLAVTSYLLSLAICIPASGWTADRFGARNVFRVAIAVFMLGSIGCAASRSLDEFVLARVIQGMGGAMMTPVGRLIMVRTVDKSNLLNAMSLVTMPALIGPIAGPPLGGFITTYASWHWIFLINVPIGLVGIVLASRYIANVRVEHRDPFDFVGFMLSGLAIAGLAFGLSAMGLESLPVSVVVALICVGAVSAVAYVVHAGGTPAPILDLNLLRLPTFRASVAGGFLFRLGIGALPFLLPLLLQVGFNLSPFQSGLITFTSALGSMFMKAAVTFVLNRFGYRNVLLYNALISSAFVLACATFVPGMPFTVMIIILLSGGFFRSLQFTSINTIAYAEIERAKMSRATAMVAAAQQLSLSTGVAVGALVVETTLWLKHATTMTAADFPPAFIVVGLLSASAAFIFMRLPPDAGSELSGRKAAEADVANKYA
ncbi:MAG TPA: DHA2 family efflux MFS transporter permease subunit [Xanthobacteraceae bacterium]|jgi:EmrB/QacA subfamily drug resistance transporter|nr:DHA2 family efflux MFS transporter permease subunit [Xanthobacteraceae bacterium]